MKLYTTHWVSLLWMLVISVYLSAETHLDIINRKVQAVEGPFFVVLITSRNNESRVAWNLGSVFCQDFPQEAFHIIYVDDASTDGTADKV